MSGATSADLSRKWVSNSSQGANSIDPFATDVVATLLYVTGLVSIIVLLHSYFLHRRKFDSIRICTDIGAVVCILSALLEYIAEDNPSEINNAVLMDLIVNGILTATLQLCDSYLFYSRYLAIQRLSRWCRMTLHGYIWLILIWTWLITFTFAPFIADTNSTSYVHYCGILMNIYVGGLLCFNTYITVRCCHFLFKFLAPRVYREEIKRRVSGFGLASDDVNSCEHQTSAAETNASPTPIITDDFEHVSPAEQLSRSQHAMNTGVDDVDDDTGGDNDYSDAPGIQKQAVHRKLKIIAIKSIGHACTSSLASLLSAYEPTGVGYAIWNLLILLGMHLWFNWRLEKYLCPAPTSSHMISRIERELRVMLDARQNRQRDVVEIV